MSLCPGQDQRKITIYDVTCPNCGHQVEMFSDELRVRCPHCKTMVYKEQMPSCIQWCRAARDCVGPAMYEELMGGKEAMPVEKKQEKKPLTATARKPTEILSEEHQLILRALTIAREQADSLRRTGQVNRENIQKLVTFFRQFADKFHHAKEEDLLFIKMKQRGMPVDGGPIGVMLAEHQDFRGYLAAVADALSRSEDDDSLRNLIIRNLSAYIEGLSQHIEKEDKILYPMADGILTDSDQLELQQEFLRVEERFGSDFWEHQRRVLLELSRH
jgi:hemerythrin-like domain-containing protein/ribosomal protein S27AE